MLLAILVIFNSLILAQDQAVGPLTGEVSIPTQAAGNELTGPIVDGNMVDLGSEAGEASGEAARHAKEMEIDDMRNTNIGLMGRPSHKSGIIKTLNNTMEHVHDVCDATADYIYEVRTAKERMNRLITGFQNSFTGIWTTLKEFKISDLWDIRRKWSRKLDYQIDGMHMQAYHFKAWMYEIHSTREQFTTAWKELFGTDSFETLISDDFSFDYKKDPWYQDCKIVDHAALRTLLINKSIDSIMNKKTPSKWTDFLSWASKLTLNENLAGMDEMSDIELTLAKSMTALENEKNSYNDYLALKAKVDKEILKLDKHIAVLQQNEALMKAAELKLMNRSQYTQAVSESNIYTSLHKGEIE